MLYNDIYTEIFKHSDWFDLLELKKCCHLFNNLITSELIEIKATQLLSNIDQTCDGINPSELNSREFMHDCEKSDICGHFYRKSLQYCCRKYYVPIILASRIVVLGTKSSLHRKRTTKSSNNKLCSCTNLYWTYNPKSVMYLLRAPFLSDGTRKSNHVIIKDILKIVFDKLIFKKYKNPKKQDDYMRNVRFYCIAKFGRDLTLFKDIS